MCVNICQKLKINVYMKNMNNIHHYNTMKVIARDYLSYREQSVQEVVYHIVLKLNLRKVFPTVKFR